MSVSSFIPSKAGAIPAKATPSTGKKLSASSAQPTVLRSSLVKQDEIAKRDYEIYIKSGCIDGRCQQNWEQAERELKATGTATK